MAADVPTRTVLGVVGSLRRASYNRMLLRWVADHAPARLVVDIAEDIIRLPLFDEDLEADGLPDEVVALHDRIRTADGIIIATPEYNFGVPGPMKNWLDWASRPVRRSPLGGKPILLMGASSGRTGGTVQCQGQLRISLSVLNAHVLPSPPVLLGEAADKFDADGHLVDELAQTVIGIALDRFVALIDSHAPSEGRPS
jgi:chromate reductase, NAD(P)H dehydrogenase (quinone)